MSALNAKASATGVACSASSFGSCSPGAGSGVPGSMVTE